MIKKIFKDIFTSIWKYFDLICFLGAILFAVWGCFILSFIAGVFSIAVGLILVGYLSEKIASLQ
ncbi:DUF1056 family protein [Limosilactobacillus reuteri]|uniref:DUF1056 family protein n=1 Tax=Limosilactobacillus reuteri TaxID=1598 RepID=UPI0032EDBB88